MGIEIVQVPKVRAAPGVGRQLFIHNAGKAKGGR
jgi:hypothetical protein